jgi:hypothetical protein
MSVDALIDQPLFVSDGMTQSFFDDPLIVNAKAVSIELGSGDELELEGGGLVAEVAEAEWRQPFSMSRVGTRI